MGNLRGAMVTFGFSAWGYSAAGDLSVESDKVDVGPSAILGAGTGDGQADLMYHRRVAITAGQVHTYTFSGSALTDVFGDSLNLVKIKALYVRNVGASATGGKIRVAGTNGVVGLGIDVRPGEASMKACAAGQGDNDATCYPVSAGSTDVITVTNTDGSLATTYEIVVIGTSA